MLIHILAALLLPELVLSVLSGSELLPGPCPMMVQTKKTKLKGDMYNYGMYLDIEPCTDPVVNVCEQTAYPNKEIKSTVVIATDDTSYVVHWKCQAKKRGKKHSRATFVYTKLKEPTVETIKAINDTHHDLGLDTEKIVVFCRPF